MRAALVSGPSTPGQPPTGLLTLATLARNAGWDVDLIELPALDRLDAFLRRLAGADLVGFTTVCSTYPRVLLVSQIVRACRPGVAIVLGGPQATITARRTVQRFPSVDLVVRGEAEAAWPCLLEEVASGRRDWSRVPGAVWSDGTEVRAAAPADLVANLDTVPMPAFDLDPGFGDGSRVAVEVGRGCPYGCTFCSTNTFFKRRFRMKSVERILSDVAYLRTRFGTVHFDFIHDMFTVRSDTVEAICGALEGAGITWNCSARTDRLTPDLLDRMVRAGCRGIYVGIETGSERLQKDTRKNLVPGDALKTIRLCQSKGLNITASLIFGFPQETVQDLYDTLLCYFELATPHPSPAVTASIVPQLHMFAPLAETPILDAGKGYAFDGRMSGTVRVDYPDGLSQDERRMIAGDFELFSAFYHPLGTDVPRDRQLALDAVFEALPQFPHARSYIARYARLEFAAFLIEGPFDVSGTLPATERARLALEMFSRLRSFDPKLRTSLDRDVRRLIALVQ